MGSLAFFPWLKVTEAVSVGAHSLLLYSPGAPFPDGAHSEIDVRTTERILRQYKIRRQESVSPVNLLLRDGRPLAFEMTASERKEAYEFSRHLAIAGLAARSFVGSPWGFAASGHFQLVVQPFALPFTGSVAYQNRIKGGYSVVTTSVDLHEWHLPSHLVQPVNASLDIALLQGLQSPHDPNDEDWQHVDASLTQFLLANSGSADVPFDVETHATYAAIERVCDADQSIKDCVGKVLRLLALAHRHPCAHSIRSSLGVLTEQIDDLVAGFLLALYMARGALAHGKPVLNTKGWPELELQVAGAFMFPLLLKARLAELGAYRLTIRDAADVAGLGVVLATRPFAERKSGADKNRWEQSIECIDEAVATAEIELLLEGKVEQPK